MTALPVLTAATPPLLKSPCKTALNFVPGLSLELTALSSFTTRLVPAGIVIVFSSPPIALRPARATSAVASAVHFCAIARQENAFHIAWISAFASFLTFIRFVLSCISIGIGIWFLVALPARPQLGRRRQIASAR